MPLVLLIFLISIPTVIYLIKLQEKDNLDVAKDYKTIKKILIKYKKENPQKSVNIKELDKYLKENEKINWSNYKITMDEKFLAVRDLTKKQIDDLIKNLDVPYKINDNTLYISFINSISKIEPKAVITMIPNQEILTTTTIKWDYQDSICEDNEIKDLEWKNKKERYDEPGSYKVSLRIQDKNGNWSNWSSKKLQVKEIKGIKDIAIGESSFYIIGNNGKVKVLGNNTNGQLGVDIDYCPEEFVESDKIKNVFQLASGKDHNIFLTHNKKIYGIGRNHRGQLGVGDEINSYIPVEIKGVPSPIQVAVGKDFSAALTAQGLVYVWGNNKDGQLGDLNLPFRSLPFQLKDVKNIKQISLGYNHGLALCYDGLIIAWGNNSHGQLGMGIKCKSSEPIVTTKIQNAVYVSSGKEFSLAVTNDGKLYGWGKADLGQLGLDEKSDILFPRQIAEIKDVEYISSKDSFVLALKKDKTVWTWGTYNFNNEIPNTIYTPKKIEDIKYVNNIAAGYNNALVLTTENKVISWNKDLDKKNILFKYNDN